MDNAEGVEECRTAPVGSPGCGEVPGLLRKSEIHPEGHDRAHATDVVDGTLCFDEKLANGLGDVLAEFSLIVEMDGTHYTMAGNVLIEGQQVSAGDGYIVDAPIAVDIDLR